MYNVPKLVKVVAKSSISYTIVPQIIILWEILLLEVMSNMYYVSKNYKKKGRVKVIGRVEAWPKGSWVN